jgi:hypothetical protein
MTILDSRNAASLDPVLYEGRESRWRPMHRIEDSNGSVSVVIDAVSQYPFERLVYAEGDSWFDKFTPIPMVGTNLLDAIRTPFFTGVVDVSHVGDEVHEMVSGYQALQTTAMFKLFDFDAILLSAGGNDLKRLFTELYAERALSAAGQPVTRSPEHLERAAAAPASVDEFFERVVGDIRRFIALRDASRSERTRNAPLLLHGYDYLQPRPAPGSIFSGSRIGVGPWLYPTLRAAGLTDEEMLAAARQVIDALNGRLRMEVAALPNVIVIDQRRLLTPAAPGSSGVSNDWMDEIHPTATGFLRLTRNRWDVALATALGWDPRATDLRPPMDGQG